MSKEQIVGLAVRLFAIYLFLYGVTQVFAFLSVLRTEQFQGGASPIFYIIAFALIVLLICALLWFFPLFIARRLIPRDSDGVPGVNTGDIFVLAFIVLGIWILASTIPDAVSLLANLFLSPIYQDMPEEMVVQVRVAGARLIVEFVIAVGLIFGARGLKNFFYHIRGIGNDAKNRPHGQQ